MGYMSEPIVIDNGIGQGDLLSMGLYQYYNADLLDIPRNKGESSLAYIDDASMIVTADTFAKVHNILVDMMTRAGGVNDWSTSHNSPLEYLKLALIDFAHGSSTKERLSLQLPQRVIDPLTSTKYLGVIFDQNLSWKAQQARAIGKGVDWSIQIKRLTRLTWGIIPSLARRLFISIAILRILYMVDVWCLPPGSSGVAQRGSVRAIE